ncbi:hypothetical protein LINGRAHAP2_LOCUS15000 [Linum grandiflorum]
MFSLRNYGTAAPSAASFIQPWRRTPSPFFPRSAPLQLLRCSFKVEELSMEDYSDTNGSLNSSLTATTANSFSSLLPRIREEEEDRKQEEDGEEDDYEEDDEKGISRIRVPRQKYIPVSKADILDAILLKFFDSQDDADQFLNLSSCLDSVLNAEHKSILEEMRTDYSLLQSTDTKGIVDEGSSAVAEEPIANGEDLNSILDDTVNGRVSDEKDLGEEAKVNMPLHFNYGLDFRNLLRYSTGNGRRVKTASPRRGYATERDKGLLIGEKLDYIQSRLLQKIFFLASKPLGKVSKWIKQSIREASETQEAQHWINKMAPWVEELSSLRSSFITGDQASDDPQEPNEISDNDLPIWLAAQKAVSRYEGFLSPSGPRERLFRRLMTWIGLVPPIPEMSFEHSSESNDSETHLRPIFLSRISLSDIWKPATRKYCGNNPWKMFRKAFSIVLSQSVLQEPAFEELILLYTENENENENERDNTDKEEVASLRLKIYEQIPIPDLLVVFPHKKLSFRILDTWKEQLDLPH